MLSPFYERRTGKPPALTAPVVRDFETQYFLGETGSAMTGAGTGSGAAWCFEHAPKTSVVPKTAKIAILDMRISYPEYRPG
jgi:peptidoglycan hydrolase-like protein with peptidoglycan-binding domain